MKAVYEVGAYTLSLQREEIKIETAYPTYEDDPAWTYTDSHGHAHDASKEILEWIVTGTEVGGDEYEWYEYEVGEWRCKLCGEVVEPGRRMQTNPTYLPGLLDARLTTDGFGWMLTGDEAKTIPAEGPTDEWVAMITARNPDYIDESFTWTNEELARNIERLRAFGYGVATEREP